MKAMSKQQLANSSGVSVTLMNWSSINSDGQLGILSVPVSTANS